MFTFAIVDQKEVRRFRMAQFNGKSATVRSGDRTVTGRVRSVREEASSTPTRWIITIVPGAPGKATAPLPVARRHHSFAEDFRDFYE